MNGMKSEKGQALILLAFGIVALIGFTALAIDGGRVLSDRRQAQNAADTAVLAAALSKINGATQSVYYDAGSDRAEDNKYGNAKYPNTTVEVNDCGPLKGTADECKGLPGTAVHSEYIRVRITSNVPMTFGRVLGRQSVTNVVEAIARVQGSTSTGFFFGNAGMVSTKKSTTETCFDVNGGANLNIYGAGIVVNCSFERAIIYNGNANISFEDDVVTAGCVKDQNGYVEYNNGAEEKCYQTLPDINENTFSSVPKMLPTPNNCDSLPVQNPPTNVNPIVLPPGRYINTPNFNNKPIQMEAGTYCFYGDVNTNSGANLKQNGSGTVKIVMFGSASMNLSGSDNTFDDVEFYMQNGNLKIDGSLTATRLRFFASGTGSWQQQNGYITSGNAYFYTEGGNFTINAQAILNLHAPGPGDTFGGLLFHKPWSNEVGFDLNGGTNSVLYGTILMPKAKVQLNGGSNMEVHGQIIASDFIINGSNKADIYYDPADNYTPPSDPTIELTK